MDGNAMDKLGISALATLCDVSVSFVPGGAGGRLLELYAEQKRGQKQSANELFEANRASARLLASFGAAPVNRVRLYFCGFGGLFIPMYLE